MLILRLVQEILAVAAAKGVTPLGFDGFDPIAFMKRDEVAIEASMQQMVAFNRGSAKPAAASGATWPCASGRRTWRRSSRPCVPPPAPMGWARPSPTSWWS
ncbi:hypothetical protein ACFQU7_25595 [Pseudoroseomonas wenyumeiae]